VRTVLILLDRPLAHAQAQFQQFSTNALSSPEPIVLGHLPEEARSCPRRPEACGLASWTCASRTGERTPDASLRRVSGCTITRACCQVRTSLASRTRSMRSVQVNVGRFTCRLRTMRWWRRRAFSAISSDLPLPRSVRVSSGKEVTSGFVQRAPREESASKQPATRRWRVVKTRPIPRLDLSCLVMQKGRPPLASWPSGTDLPHVLLNGPLADADAQLE